MSGSVLMLNIGDAPWGAETSFSIIASELRRRGYTVEVACCSSAVADFFAKDGIRVHTFESAHGRLSKLLSAVRALRSIETSYDAVLLFSLDLLPLAYFRALLGSVSRRWVADLHDRPSKSVTLSVVRMCTQRLDENIAISEYVASMLPARAPRSIVPRPIFADDGSALQDRFPDRTRVSIVGRIDREKNIELAIEALRHLPESFTLTVAGSSMNASDDYIHELRSTSEKYAPGRVLFVGRVEIQSHLTNVDVLVSANPAEPSGRTIIEAMARGVIAVVPDQGGTSELVSHLDTGIVYKAGDAGGLARALSWVHANPEEAAAIRVRARQWVSETRSPARVARQYADALWDTGSASG